MPSRAGPEPARAFALSLVGACRRLADRASVAAIDDSLHRKAERAEDSLVDSAAFITG